MESIVVFTENAEQQKVVKAFLKDLKIQFESRQDIVPNCIAQNIDEGLKQAENSQIVPLQEFSYKYF